MIYLYITNEDDKQIVINQDKLIKLIKETGSKKIKFEIGWDPHSGIYFYGNKDLLKNFQNVIENKTNFATK